MVTEGRPKKLTQDEVNELVRKWLKKNKDLTFNQLFEKGRKHFAKYPLSTQVDALFVMNSIVWQNWIGYERLRRHEEES